MLEFLIKKGADVNAKNLLFDSPLHRAIAENQPEMLKLLIVHGANIDEKSVDGLLTLQKAIQEKSIDTIPILVKCGFSTIVKDKDRNNPLELALKNNNCPAFKQFAITCDWEMKTSYFERNYSNQNKGTKWSNHF